MTPDPRWLEILKASGWQTAAIAIACWLVLWANRANLMPALEPWMVQSATAAMIICGLLALGSIASNTVVQIGAWSPRIKKRWALRHSLQTLNADETTFLKGQVGKNQITTQLHPFNAQGIPNFVHQSAMYQGLQNKGIVTVTAADPQGKIQTITIEKPAWKLLKKKFKKEG